MSIKPVKLKASPSGTWLRHWSNGEDVLTRDEHDRLGVNKRRLSANVYRADYRGWVIRLFTWDGTSEGTTIIVDTLRQTRLALGWLATHYQTHWYGTEALRKAVAATYSFEADEIRAELGW
jgi:hypothetical protein